MPFLLMKTDERKKYFMGSDFFVNVDVSLVISKKYCNFAIQLIKICYYVTSN